eukprot:3328449-Pleurochrysis_carterae.AAC.1
MAAVKLTDASAAEKAAAVVQANLQNDHGGNEGLLGSKPIVDGTSEDVPKNHANDLNKSVPEPTPKPEEGGNNAEQLELKKPEGGTDEENNAKKDDG